MGSVFRLMSYIVSDKDNGGLKPQWRRKSFSSFSLCFSVQWSPFLFFPMSSVETLLLCTWVFLNTALLWHCTFSLPADFVNMYDFTEMWWNNCHILIVMPVCLLMLSGERWIACRLSISCLFAQLWSCAVPPPTMASTLQSPGYGLDYTIVCPVVDRGALLIEQCRWCNEGDADKTTSVSAGLLEEL